MIIDSVKKNMEKVSDHEEFSKDANGFFGQIGSFLGTVGSTISVVAKSTAEKFGIDEKINKAKTAISESPIMNKIGETTKTVGDAVKTGYERVMSTSVAQKVVQTAEHSYVNLKRKIQSNLPSNEQNNMQSNIQNNVQNNVQNNKQINQQVISEYHNLSNFETDPGK